MKRFFCVLLSIAMLLSLAACGAEETEPTLSPEAQAFEAACKLLEEGKYQEAIEAFSRLESYRKVQSKIDEAARGLEAQQLAAEEAARQALLQQVGFLYGTTWRDTRSTAELTFAECQDDYSGGFTGTVHSLDWIDSTTKREADYIWYLRDGQISIPYLPCLPRDGAPEEGFPVTVEERNGVTHLLVGDCDFVRNEDYTPYEPASVEITLDNWQEYFEIREGYKWEQDDFGVTIGVRIITAIVLKEEYRDRIVLDLTDVTFGYTSDHVERSVSQIDFENRIALPGVVTFLFITDEAQTKNFSTTQYHLTTNNETVAEFPRVYLLLTEGYYSPATVHSSHRFYTYQDHKIDRVAGTLMLRPE